MWWSAILSGGGGGSPAWNIENKSRGTVAGDDEGPPERVIKKA
jgi:hypothetical protein